MARSSSPAVLLRNSNDSSHTVTRVVLHVHLCAFCRWWFFKLVPAWWVQLP